MGRTTHPKPWYDNNKWRGKAFQNVRVHFMWVAFAFLEFSSDISRRWMTPRHYWTPNFIHLPWQPWGARFCLQLVSVVSSKSIEADASKSVLSLQGSMKIPPICTLNWCIMHNSRPGLHSLVETKVLICVLLISYLACTLSQPGEWLSNEAGYTSV